MRLGAVLLAGLMFTGFAKAEGDNKDSKVVIVDMQKAVQTSSRGKKAKSELETEFNKRKKDLDKKKADIDKMAQDLEKKKSVLSDEVFGKKQGEVQEEMMKFQKTVAENQMEIQKKERDLTEPILKDMKDVITKIAKDKNYAIVLEKTENNILYVRAENDITDEVIRAFESKK